MIKRSAYGSNPRKRKAKIQQASRRQQRSKRT